MLRRLSLLFAGLLATTAIASAAPLPAGNPASPRIASAIEAAENGQFSAAQYADLAHDPLYGWVEFAALKRDIDTLPPAQAQAFLARYRGQAVAEAFRPLWLASLSRREDWTDFRAAWSPAITSTVLRCAELDARQATGAADAQWTSDALALWRSTGKPLPADCDTPFAILAAKGGLPPALRWERIDKAAGEWNAAVMRDAARGLPPDQLALANDYAAFMDAIHERALQWPKTERSRWIASQGLARLAKSVPAAAEAQLPKYATALDFTEADRGRVLYQVALWSAASYEPESARRLAAVPAASWDERLHEWQAREAMARSDWKGALAAIRAMPAAQRSDPHWTYFEGRLLELTGDKAGARAAYARAAREPQFHGFLAADRIDAPYALCPWLPHDSDAARAKVAADPAMVRAMALYRIDRRGWAQAEWDDALSRFDDAQRRLAVEVAQDNGWFDRAVFALGHDPHGESRPDELRLYELRFPLHHADSIRREAARNRLDPAWIAGEIRAESIFDPNARSPANAMGLMQVLPTTGLEVARKIGASWNGAQSLYDPDTNIMLGSAYLRQLLDKYGDAPYLTIAGYNAGPGPVARWQGQRPGMEPDFWIETISYKETRDYVARVLAFSTIYDWRLNGKALPLSDRMRGVDGPRKAFLCPLATP